MRAPYHRDQVVIAMHALNRGDWTAARAYSEMPRKQVIEDLEDLIASGVIPVRLREQFDACLHGERVAEILSRPIVESAA